jgi:hypothetical protein
MMDPSVHHATGRLQATSDLPCDDDDTVVTPNRGESSKSIVKSSVEITLRFRFVPSQNNDNIHPAILHANWMHEAIMAFGSDKIQFFDNRNRQVSKIEPLRIDPEMHVQQFHLHFDRHTRQHKNTTYTNNNQDHKSVSTYIVHRIRSVVSLSELKATNSIFKLMKEHNFYVYMNIVGAKRTGKRHNSVLSMVSTHSSMTLTKRQPSSPIPYVRRYHG